MTGQTTKFRFAFGSVGPSRSAAQGVGGAGAFRTVIVRPDWAALALLLAVLTIAGAWAFQWAGYSPCELCLKERQPYYVGMVVAAVTLVAERWSPRWLARVGYGILALVFLFSAAFGTYHAGVEWGWWAGPTECTGAVARAHSSADFLQQLSNTKVVRCDAVAVRVLGLSLAVWNAVLSFLVTCLAIAGLVGLRWTKPLAAAGQ